jgi:hypothetical protein
MSIDTDLVHDVADPAPTAQEATTGSASEDVPPAIAEAAPEGLAEATALIWHNPDLLTESRIARSAVVGALVGIVMFTLAITGLALWVGLEPPAAIGLGLFTALWGGLGFGGMLGAVIAINRIEEGR